MSTQYDTNPGSKSPEDVQREARQSRAQVEQSLDALQERRSRGQLFENAGDYIRTSSANDFLRNVGARIREDPLPMVLVGTGLAWLMLSATRSRRRDYFEDDDLLEAWPEGHYGTGDYPGGYYAGGEDSDEYQEAALFGGSSRGQDYRRGGGSYAERARRLGAGARERLGHTGEYMRHGVRGTGQYGRSAQSGFAHMLEEQPLVVGAIGLAVGAALGAALPKTETEDEWLGDTRDQLKERARRMTREQLERARAAARAAYEAAIEEADRQGWSAEGAMSAADAAAKKAERVAAAATEAARAEAERQSGEQAGSSAHSQVSGASGSSTGSPMTEAERHGLGQPSSRIPSGT